MTAMPRRSLRLGLLAACAAVLNFLPLNGPAGFGLLAGSFLYLPLVMTVTPPWATAIAGLALLPTVDRFGHPIILAIGMLEALWLSFGKRWTASHVVAVDGIFWALLGAVTLFAGAFTAAWLPRDLAFIFLAKLAINQWLAVVAGYFMMRETTLARWLEALPEPRERLRHLVFDYVFALALVPLLLVGTGLSVLLRRVTDDNDRVMLAHSVQDAWRQIHLFSPPHPLVGQTGGGIYVVAAALLVGIIGATIWVARAAGRRLSQPLEHFARSAAQQMERNVVEEIELPSTSVPVEFAQVFSAFNGLAAKLRESQEELRRQNAELDSRVARRTADLDHARDVAEKADRSKTDFIARTIHEIRTPLNAMIGLAEALEAEVAKPAAIEQLRLIASSGRRLRAVTNDLLDLARIQSGKLEITTQAVELRALCREVHALYALRAAQGGVEFPNLVDSPIPLWVRTDGGRVRQILVNLVDNALKFTARGEVRLQLAAGGCNGTSITVTFSVSDTGPGIAPHDQVKLFTPYVQLEHGREKPAVGTGLGLAISRRLVQLLGGTLQLQSALGRGSTFSFTLTLPVASEQSAGSPMTPAPLTAPARRYPNAKVLVVDDNPANQEVMRAMVEPLVGSLTVVGSAAQAIACLEGERFDVAFIDLEMPEADGFTVATAVRGWRAAEASRDCRLIAFSAYPRETMHAKCAASGFSGFLGKPIVRQELLRHLAPARGAISPAA